MLQIKINDNLKKINFKESNKSLNFFKNLFAPNYKHDKQYFSQSIINLLRLLLCAFFTIIILQFFVNNLFISIGINGIALTFGQIDLHYDAIDHSLIILYISIIALNIPLIFFAWYYVSKKLASYTLFYLVFLTLMGIWIGPLLVKHIDFFYEFYTYKLKIINIHFPINSLLFACIGGILMGLNYAIIYSSSGCTGGIDFISFYFALKKKYNFARLNLYFKYFLLFFLIILLYFFGNYTNSSNFHFSFFQYITSMQVVGTAIYVFIITLVYQALYPINTFVSINIITQYPKKIKKLFCIQNQSYQHTFTKLDAVGTYNNQKQYMLITIMSWFEYYYYLEKLKKYPNLKSFIYISNVSRVLGKYRNKEIH